MAGVTKFCTEPADQVIHKANVGGPKNPDLSAIAELCPDLVILNTEENRKEDVEFLNDRYRTWVTFPRTLSDSADTVESMGKIFAVEERAFPFVRAIHALRPVRASIRTLYLIWRQPWMSINRDTYIHDVLESHGMKNVCADLADRYPILTTEFLHESRPELILLPDEPFLFQDRHRDEIQSQSWAADAEIEFVQGSYFCWYGTRTARASDYIRNHVAFLQKRILA